MDYQLLVVLHLLGLALLLFGFGVLFTTSAAGLDSNKKARLPGIISHGLGLLILILTGFTMLTQLKGTPHGWLGGKVLIWLALGGFIVLIRKKPQFRKLWIVILFLLVLSAAYLGRLKPF